MLKPFTDLCCKLNSKYGIPKITPSMCASVDKNGVINEITTTNVRSYVNQPIEKYEDFYNKLHNSLNNSYYITFDWDGKPRRLVLVEDSTYHIVFKHYARFVDSNNYTKLDLEFNEKTYEFIAYMGYPHHEEIALQRTKNRMSNIKITKISI